MSVLHRLVADVPLPDMLRVRQRFARPVVEDVAAATRAELERGEILEKLRPGMSVAVTAGSRGIRDMTLVIKTVVGFLRQKGAQPFVIPAMGSHGGATAEGQLAILRDYGITEEALGCPIRATMETVAVGNTPDGREVSIDRHAAAADGIVVINRIKPHTAFRGRYESGLMKMMAIGLGKQKGAEACHSAGFRCMADNIAMYGGAVLQNARVLFGVAVLENAYDETCKLQAIPAADIPRREPALLREAMGNMAGILIPQGDVLVVDRVEENISGDGHDPNITGNFGTPYASGGFKKQRTVYLDLTREGHGNAVGVGTADFITKRMLAKIDHEAGYANTMTSNTPESYKIPIAADNHRDAIQAAVKTCLDVTTQNIRIVRISNTLQLEEIWISRALTEEARAHPRMEILSEPMPFAFDREGNLF